MLCDISPCTPEERPEALRLLGHSFTEGDRPGSQHTELASDLDFWASVVIWAARKRRRILGAVLTQTLNHTTTALWPAAVGGGPLLRPKIAQALYDYILARLRESGTRLVQTLVAPIERSRVHDELGRAGIMPVADLLYLRRSTTPIGYATSPASFQWRPFSPASVGAFSEVVRASYVDSLDLPELQVGRSADDLLARRQRILSFDPNLWHVGHLPGEPGAGAVVLLDDHPDFDTIEVTYLGLTPEARGRGLGRAALAHALQLAQGRRPVVELAVDTRNVPAMKLYHAAGFEPIDRRHLYVSLLP